MSSSSVVRPSSSRSITSRAIEMVPRRELSPYGHGVALMCVLLLLGAQWLELRRWA